MKTKISIIGAGIAGLSTAIAIQKNNPDITLEIFERSPLIKPVGAGLILAANAVMGFDQIGIKDKVLEVCNILDSICILNQQGNVLSKTDNISINRAMEIISNFSVHRAALHSVLLSQIPTIPIHLNKRTVDFSTDALGTTIVFDDGTTTRTDFVIAADGIHSIFREKLVPSSKVRYAGYTCWRGICDIHLLKNKISTNLNLKSASETWGRGKRFGIVAVSDHQIYWFACINTPTIKDGKFAAYGNKELVEAFRDFHDPVTQIIEQTSPETILWNDIIDFAPISKYAFGNIVLIGDAAHATTPNMGQGACQAIEDAAVLGNLFSKHMGIQAVFQLFEQKRIKRASAIVNKSWQIGKIAQLENSILTRLRNFSVSCIPESINRKQIESLISYQY